jgi:hypothetical protein
MRVQRSSNVNAGHGVQDYSNGDRAALLFMRTGDEEVFAALSRVFALHEAPTVDLCHAAPDPDRTAGGCVIRNNGILVTIQSVVHPSARSGGPGMYGLSLDLTWGETSPVWTEAALKNGYVTACLISESRYERATSLNGDGRKVVDTAKIPSVPVLKLGALLG